MAVVRAERAETGTFAQVLGEALQGLEGLAEQDRVDWQQLVKLVLPCAPFHRPRREHTAILAAVRASIANAELRREVEDMANSRKLPGSKSCSPRARNPGRRMARRAGLPAVRPRG